MAATILGWLAAAVFAASLAVVGYWVWLTQKIAAQAERLAPPIGRFVEVDGNRIHYVDEGEGRPILFVHGLGAQLRQLRYPLFSRLGGYRLVALDRPGSGYSTRAAGSGGRLSEQAALIAAFIERLGLEKPLVVGHSLGGAVALTLAVEHPQAISGMALLSPLTHLETEVRPQFRPLYVKSRLKRWLLCRTVAVPNGLKYAAPTLAFIFGPQKPPADYMVDGGGWIGLRPSHIFATMTDMVDIEKDLGRIEARYGEIAVPAGMLFGTQDRVLDFAVHGEPMTRRMPGLDFEAAEGIGHMPQFADPEGVASFVRRTAERAFG